MVFYVCPTVGPINTFIGEIIFGCLLLNYFFAAMLNPGIEMSQVRDDELDPEEPDNYCDLCAVYKGIRTEHCGECGVCIVNYDHHCPWTSKCIGKGNLMHFYGFLLGLFSSFLFSIITMAIKSKPT